MSNGGRRVSSMKPGAGQLLLAVACMAASPPVATGAGSEPVRIEQDGLKLEMAPLAGDQIRAFFLARGFSASDAQQIAETACLFRSAIGSAQTVEGSAEVSVALSEWRVTPAGGKSITPKLREDWEPVWKARGVAEDAATAFYWSLFPTEQTFYPTDYNWGFLTFGLPSGTTFDLTVSWRNGGSSHSTTINGLECAR